MQLLGQCDVEDLKRYVAPSTISLTQHLFPGANSAAGMAALIVGQYGAAGVLSELSLRKLVLARLGTTDAVELCIRIDVPTVDPVATLTKCFASLNGSSAETLFEWFNVPYQPNAVIRGEPARKAKPTDRLRRHQTIAFRELRKRLSDSSDNVLLHMPPGAGKLRTVVTAIVDLFRSIPDTQTAIWCASDARLCEAAFVEMFNVWEDLGSRDITIYRLFGTAPMQELRKAASGIAILDLARLADTTTLDPNDVKEFAESLRCVVLNDAQHVNHPVVQEVFQKLREFGSFNVIGLFSASATYAKNTGLLPVLRRHYGISPIELISEDPIGFLTGEGVMAKIVLTTLRSARMIRLASDVDLDADKTLASNLAHDVPRNQQLIEFIEKQKNIGKNLIFYANAPDQARAFVGVLNYYGIKAVSVTGEMEFDQQRQEIKRFQNGTDINVLCVHGALVSGHEVHKADTMLIASPTSSTAVHGVIIGGFASGRAPGTILSVTIVDDGIASFSELIADTGRWERMETTE